MLKNITLNHYNGYFAYLGSISPMRNNAYYIKVRDTIALKLADIYN